MRNSKLEPSQREKVEKLLYLSDDLRSAYDPKEKFYEVIDCSDSQQVKKRMQKWLLWTTPIELEIFANIT